MKRLMLSLLAASSIAAVAIPATAANAQAWQNINQRQANLDARIDQGVRNGTITRSEAIRLRAEFRDIARLEATYRASRPGLTMNERVDLDRRFNALSARIVVARNDRDGGYDWTNINQRQRELDRRIDVGVRNGDLTRSEAYRLRSEFQRIANLERQYRRNGLNNAERADLNRRMAILDAKVRFERNDGDERFDANRYGRDASSRW